VEFIFETDQTGLDNWSHLRTITLEPNETKLIIFEPEEKGEWIRLRSNRNTNATATFFYTGDVDKQNVPNSIFDGLSSIRDSRSVGGLLYGLGDNKRTLGIAVQEFQRASSTEIGYYELDENLNLIKKDDPQIHSFIKDNFTIPEGIFEKAVQVEESSVLIVDDKGRRWRLPLGDNEYTDLTNAATMRICREVVTERDLFNCHGTFYELPAESADGYAKIRPISSHNLFVNDYASYRGLLLMTGIKPDANDSEHIIRSNDGKAAVWAGVIDDLWKLGKPIGHGGPWKDTPAKPGIPSDPYL